MLYHRCDKRYLLIGRWIFYLLDSLILFPIYCNDEDCTRLSLFMCYNTRFDKVIVVQYHVVKQSLTERKHIFLSLSVLNRYLVGLNSLPHWTRLNNIPGNPVVEFGLRLRTSNNQLILSSSVLLIYRAY